MCQVSLSIDNTKYSKEEKYTSIHKHDIRILIKYRKNVKKY